MSRHKILTRFNVGQIIIFVLHALFLCQACADNESTYNPTSAKQMEEQIKNLKDQIKKSEEEYQVRPRRKFLGATIPEYRFASYAEAWSKKIENYGNLNFPKGIDLKSLYGKVTLTISIRSDGTLEAVKITKSSENASLDEAALTLIKQAAPFDRFSPEMLKDTDILSITRTFTFTREESKQEN